MPVTQVGAIYAAQSKQLQRIEVPSSDDSEIDTRPLLAGESLQKFPIATYRSGGPQALQAAIGPVNSVVAGMCAVIDKNTNVVVDRMNLDTQIYNGGSSLTPDGNLLVRHDLAMQGDVWGGSQFTRRYVEVNPRAATALTAVVAVAVFPVEVTPTPVTPGNIMVASTTLNVGGILPAATFLNIKSKFGG